jgi:hypothetical protein
MNCCWWIWRLTFVMTNNSQNWLHFFQAITLRNELCTSVISTLITLKSVKYGVWVFWATKLRNVYKKKDKCKMIQINCIIYLVWLIVCQFRSTIRYDSSSTLIIHPPITYCILLFLFSHCLPSHYPVPPSP